MGRILLAGLFACTVLGLVVAPVSAEEVSSTELEKLRQEVNDLKATMLEQDINTYLAETQTDGVQGGGGGLQGVTIHARFTSNFLASVGQSSPAADYGIVNGDVDVDFDFQVTDNLVLFMHTTANTAGAGSYVPPHPNGVSTGATLAGAADGIGVDGTRPTNPGSFVVYEAGIRVTTPISNGEFHWEMGQIDQRTRFLQNAFAMDENTQFMNNQFDDPSSVPWLTNAGGTVSLGWHLWFELGAQKQHVINFGWFNTPGQWFRRGQFMLQYSWQGEVRGRAMNVRVTGFYSTHPLTGGGADESSGGGVSWDWMASDKIGVFITFVANNDNNTVPTKYDASIGAAWMGLGSRPDDRIGVAVGWIEPNKTALPGAKTEFVIEVYYLYAAQDGKLQITPYLQFVSEPGGGTNTTVPNFTNDSLFLLGLRIHVPF